MRGAFYAGAVWNVARGSRRDAERYRDVHRHGHRLDPRRPEGIGQTQHDKPVLTPHANTAIFVRRLGSRLYTQNEIARRQRFTVGVVISVGDLYSPIFPISLHY